MPVYAGCDYLRLTSGDTRHYGAWNDFLLPEKLEEEHAGRRKHQRWVLGYYGDVGEHYFIGRGEQGAMVQLSGYLAHRLFYDVSHVGGKATRIDLQVTQTADETPSAYLRRTFIEASAAVKREGRPPLVQETDTNYGAKMVTIGSRQSAVYGRIYDKWKESKDPFYKDMVRWELEIKQPEAPELHQWLMQDKLLSPHSKHLVENWFNKRGVMTQFQFQEMSEPPERTKRTKTDETKAAWIAAQVRPTIGVLVSHQKAIEAAKAILPDDADNAMIDALAMMLSQVYRDYAG